MENSGKVSWKLALGWGVGTLGISVMFNSMNVLMQRFATDYLGVAAATWGLIYLASKMYDAVTDPLMGVVSDRTRSRWGRRRPYLLIGGAVCALAFYLLFNVEMTGSQAGWILLGLMLLYSTGYTLFNVPYMAMPAEMTDSYHERSFVVSFRVYAIGLGTIAGISGAPLLVRYFGGGQVGHQQMAAWYALVILLASITCFYMTRNARQTSDHPQRPASSGKLSRLKILLDNRPFLCLIGVKFCQLAALALNQAVLIYFIVYVLDKGYGFLGGYALIASVCMLLTPMGFLALQKRWDKRQLFIAVSVIYALLMLTWMMSGESEPVWVIMLRGALLGACSGGMLMMGQSMLADTIAYDYKLSGERREGLLAGLYTTAEKLAFAVGGALSGIILGVMGYVSSTTGSAAQPDSAITAIYWCMGLLPAILVALSCLFLVPYKLSQDACEDVPIGSV